MSEVNSQGLGVKFSLTNQFSHRVQFSQVTRQRHKGKYNLLTFVHGSYTHICQKTYNNVQKLEFS